MKVSALSVVMQTEETFSSGRENRKMIAYICKFMLRIRLRKQRGNKENILKCIECLLKGLALHKDFVCNNLVLS